MPKFQTLVIAGADFRRAMHHFHQLPTGVAIGILRRRESPDGVVWSFDQFSWHDHPPTGRQFPPIADWCVIRRLQSGSELNSITGIDNSQPLPGQNLIVLTFTNSTDGLGGWSAVRIAGGKICPIDEVRIIGSPSLVLTTRPTGSTVSNFEINHPRWSRLRNMWGDRNLLRIANTHVMLIGASRTGSIVARQLTALGFGKLTLVDPDVLEIHNYDAMLGGSLDDIGRSKVAALADELVRFRADIAVTGLACTATDRRVIHCARQADVIITCVDHGTPVLFAAKMANRWNKIHIDIGTSVQKLEDGNLEITGDVRMFLPHEACASCVGGIGDRIDAEIDLQLPAGVQPLRTKVDFRNQRAGSLVTINTISVSVAIQELLSLLNDTGPASRWIRLRLSARNLSQFDAVDIVGRKSCGVCSKMSLHN